MNKKGQGNVGIFTVVFIAIIFLLVMAAGLGKFVLDFSNLAVVLGGLSGLEAFFVANLLLWVFIAFVLAVLYWSRS